MTDIKNQEYVFSLEDDLLYVTKKGQIIHKKFDKTNEFVIEISDIKKFQIKNKVDKKKLTFIIVLINIAFICKFFIPLFIISWIVFILILLFTLVMLIGLLNGREVIFELPKEKKSFFLMSDLPDIGKFENYLRTNYDNLAKVSQKEYDKHYEVKVKNLEKILGPMHDLVGHAIIPFRVGGVVNMYYFLKAKEGTAFVTMDLNEPDGSGPRPNRIGTFELIAFTKHKFTKKNDKKKDPFNTIERRTCTNFTSIGKYSFHARLNPGDTFEIPNDGKENCCFVCFEYTDKNNQFKINGQVLGLLLTIELFRPEMKYAMKNGSNALKEKLIEKGYFPYTDLDRETVI